MVKYFPESTIEDKFSNVAILKKQPDYQILHLGKNNATNNKATSPSMKPNFTRGGGSFN